MYRFHLIVTLARSLDMLNECPYEFVNQSLINYLNKYQNAKIKVSKERTS